MLDCAGWTQSSMWWSNWKADGCAAPGKREWYAKLMNIVGSWEEACAHMPVRWKDGTIFPQPMKCYTDWTGVFGYVWVQDDSCNPNWGEFRDDGCNPNKPGYRTYKSVLYGVPKHAMWLSWCATSGAVINGITFNGATR